VANIPSLDQKIVECMDAGLQAFGENTKHIVYYCLERDFGLKKNEIPERPETFSRAITSIFGEGAGIIGELIVKKMTLSFKLKQSKLTFTEAVVALKAKQQ